MEKKRYDINAVSRMLGTTSRTLRFYEEKKIISSSRTDFSPRRQYTEEQIEEIKQVLVLREIGLSVSTIQKWKNEKGDLRLAIEENKARILALISEKLRTLRLQSEALSLIEGGKDVLEIRERSPASPSKEYERIARVCAGAIVSGDLDALYAHIGDKLRAYMPKEVFRTVREDTLRPLGAFVGYGELNADPERPYILDQDVEYENLGLRIRFVFNGDTVSGLWVSYYEWKGESK